MAAPATCSRFSKSAAKCSTNCHKVSTSPPRKCGPAGNLVVGPTTGAAFWTRCQATASSRRSDCSPCGSAFRILATTSDGKSRMLTCWEWCKMTGLLQLIPNWRATQIAAWMASIEICAWAAISYNAQWICTPADTRRHVFPTQVTRLPVDGEFP
jgi:hypothetical protein